jgi:tetratricopeptide (TPR) repeat protein
VAGRFVGRVHELDVACRALDATAAGQGAVLVLAGEAGIGKSRLARETASLARQRDMEVIWSTGWPGGGAPAYWPWPEVLGAVHQPSDAAIDLTSTSADPERFSRFRAVGATLERRAVQRPVVVVLDDAHTFDADGLLLTRFVARSVVGHRLLLLVAHRTTPEVPPSTATLLGEIGREGSEVPLDGLDIDELREFLAASGERPREAAVRHVRELTSGNPFLVEQVLGAGLHHSDRPVPGSALRLLDAQLDALDDTTRTVLESAAVLGSGATLFELAVIASVDRTLVERSRDVAAGAGLVRPERTARFVFSHDLARETIVSRLGPGRLADLHERCLDLLGTGDESGERAVRRARHALELARCSKSQTPRAVEVARASARLLLQHGAPEAAVELLGDALATQEAGGRDSLAPLVAELGTAMLATGRLADARRLFRRAVVDAERSGDEMTYAEAALGLGGVWVQEQRSSEERDYYNRVVERAVRVIADDPSPLAPRVTASLRLRQAAERAAAGAGTVDEVRGALEAVRTQGHLDDVAAGLSLLHHVMLGPAYATERLAVAGELVAVARSCGNELQTVMGQLWSVTDALLLGRDADRALSELRERADALGMQAILFVIEAIDVMRRSRDGHLDAAEKAAAACLDRGIEVGDADASAYYGAHLLALRWYAGTGAELLELAQELVASPAMPLENPVFTAVVASFAADAGDTDRAEQAIARLGRGRLDQLLPGSSWLVTMFALVEAAVRLDDAGLAEELYDLLAPYAPLPIMGSIGVCCFGSAERSLGLAARVGGRFDEAIGHLERAVTENKRLGNRPMTAIARADLAETLIASGEPGGRARAGPLLARAIEAGDRMRLVGRLPGWWRLRDGLDHAQQTREASCVRHGEEWELVADGERALVTHTVGMDYLAALLAAPGCEISAGELAGVELSSPAQDVLDAPALRSLGRRMSQLEDEIDRATLRGEGDRADQLQRELDEIVGHARAVTRPGERSRRFDDAAERARTSVQKAIRRAIINVARSAPHLGDELLASVHTGHRCAYEPTRGAPEAWTVRVR